MKALILFLFTAVAFGQSSGTICTTCGTTISISPYSVDISENIPDLSVEPQYNGAVPYCPRSDFTLKWYVVKAAPTQVGWTWTYATSSNATYSSYSSPKYRFVAACVR